MMYLNDFQITLKRGYMMIQVNEVMFWISVLLLVISIVFLFYVYVKHKDLKTIIHIWILFGASLVCIVMQQLGIIFGTRTGGDLSFIDRYLFSMLGMIIFTILVGYFAYIILKVVRYIQHLELQQK